MKIKEMISQHRRDFSATMKCEFCGHTMRLTSGYDDRNYYDNVIPNMKCDVCGNSTMSGDGRFEHIVTNVPEGMQQ